MISAQSNDYQVFSLIRNPEALHDTSLLEKAGDIALGRGAIERALGWYNRAATTPNILAKRVRCLIEESHFEEAQKLLTDPKMVQVARRVRELLALEVKIGLGKFLDAICDARHASKEYPEEGKFFLRTPDAWLAYDALGRKKHPEMSLFRSNFDQIRQVFSSQPCYSASLWRPEDIMQQEIDLCDYCMTRGDEAIAIFVPLLRERLTNEQFRGLFLAHVERKISSIVTKRKELETIASVSNDPEQVAIEREGIAVGIMGRHGMAGYARRYADVLREIHFSALAERWQHETVALQKIADAQKD